MRLCKKEALTHWRELLGSGNRPHLNPSPIAYKHTGSTYGADGIRIEGTTEFIDSVLARLGDLLDHENTETRLALNYQQVEPREDKPNAYAGNWVCYVKVHERGHEAKAVNAFAKAMGSKHIVSAGY